MLDLTIADVQIRVDGEGRFCLNDLHRAAGAEPHHQPGKFFANKGTQELVAELQGASPNSESPVQTVNDGRNNGTYVAKELVYAYAMWISPAFLEHSSEMSHAAATRSTKASLGEHPTTGIRAIPGIEIDAERRVLRFQGADCWVAGRVGRRHTSADGGSRSARLAHRVARGAANPPNSEGWPVQGVPKSSRNDERPARSADGDLRCRTHQ